MARTRKLLILSDLHFPRQRSQDYKAVIKKERPDNILLLGDNTEAFRDEVTLDLYKKFFAEYSKVFPLKKTMVMIGDNDEGEEINEYLAKADIMNPGQQETYSIGNMFFFHGNMELFEWQEKLNTIIGNWAMAINERIIPFMLSNIVRFRCKIPEEDYLFLGHIHYLNSTGKNTFCGTFRANRMLDRINRDIRTLGYVTVMHKDFITDGNIKLHPFSKMKLEE